MQLDLTEVEAKVLENHRPELREEDYKTESFEWRESLKPTS